MQHFTKLGRVLGRNASGDRENLARPRRNSHRGALLQAVSTPARTRSPRYG